jgi:excisionase family DNA binding protein
MLRTVMSLKAYVSSVEAAAIMGVSEQYVRHLCANKKIRSEKIGKAWLVLRADAVKFKRKPGMGRPFTNSRNR